MRDRAAQRKNATEAYVQRCSSQAPPLCAVAVSLQVLSLLTLITIAIEPRWAR